MTFHFVFSWTFVLVLSDFWEDNFWYVFGRNCSQSSVQNGWRSFHIWWHHSTKTKSSVHIKVMSKTYRLTILPLLIMFCSFCFCFGFAFLLVHVSKESLLFEIFFMFINFTIWNCCAFFATSTCFKSNCITSHLKHVNCCSHSYSKLFVVF